MLKINNNSKQSSFRKKKILNSKIIKNIKQIPEKYKYSCNSVTDRKTKNKIIT